MRGVVGAGGNQTEITRVEQFAAHQAGHPGFTFAFAIGAAQGTQTRLGHIAAVHGP